MMVKSWQLQDAKNRFSQVVNEALAIGPQVVTKHGTQAVVILSYEEYRRLTANYTNSLVDFFRASPLTTAELDLTRDTTPLRDAFVVES
jgi:antitoxin Phd